MSTGYAPMLAACLLMGCAGSGGSSLLQYRTNGAGQFEAHFVDSSDALLVLEGDERFRRELRFFSPDGDLIADTSLEDYLMSPPGSFLLVDRYHIAMRARAPDAGYGIVPATDQPSVVARSVLGWIEAAGGLLEDRLRLSAATNAFADVSCAIGADGSIAVWSTSGDPAFYASPPYAVPDARWVVGGVFCLKVEGRPSAVAVGVEPGAVIARIFAGGEGPPVALPLAFDGHPVSLGSGEHAGESVIVGLAPELGPSGSQQQTLIATRITFQAGAWRAEHARLSGWPTPMGRTLVRNAEIISARPGALRQVLHVPWPDGVQAIAFEPQIVSAPDEDFYRDVLRNNVPIASPTGRRTLWIDARGELRLESGGF